MNKVAGILLVAALQGTVNFIFTYWLTARWWKDEVGRSLMAFAFGEGCILLLSALAMVFGHFWGQQALGMLAFAGFTAMSWWRWIAMLRILLRPKAAADEEENNGS